MRTVGKSGRTAGICTFILLSGMVSALAQVSEDFSDGNFTSNPPWTGDSARFEVNTAAQLHLKTAGTDSAFLVTPCSPPDSTEWQCWVKLSFSPSGNNYARIYLVSDQPSLHGPLNGFYLQLGEAGSSDAICLYRQEGNLHHLVCRGDNGCIASSFTIRIRVTREASGWWTLAADSSGGQYFQVQAQGLDTTPPVPGFFGLYCKYTTSNATKFYFDDVVVKKLEVDKQPPLILSVRALNPSRVEVLFSEAVGIPAATNPRRYLIGQGVGHPESAVLQSGEGNTVGLDLMQELQDNSWYTLYTDSLPDLAGNMTEPSVDSFFHYRPKAYDIVINEIMADPEPQVGLPPFEYLELYNRTSHPVNLDNWTLNLGSTKKRFPPCTLPGDAYLILADSAAEMLFSTYGDFLGFPSFTLSNEGSVVTLGNSEGRMIHSVGYSSDWYGDPLKEGGGWALEQADPGNPCAGSANWKASTASKGGTPGTRNAVSRDNPDLSGPYPDRVSVSGPFSLTVFFNEPLDSTSLSQCSQFSITPGNPGVIALSHQPPAYDRVHLLLGHPMDSGSLYTLHFLAGLADCAGNNTPPGCTLGFGLPEDPRPGDLVINELLFDPSDGIPEFVEIFNNSTRIIELKPLLLAQTDSLTLLPETCYPLCAEGRLFFPGEYLAFTPDPPSLASQYNGGNPAGLVRMPGLPALSNEKGCLSLASLSGPSFDPVIYSVEMHHPLLTQTTGVSLERISPLSPGTKRDNWHSAASACGYATPAKKNSQQAGDQDAGAEITLSPPVFSPDNDGYQDILRISWTFSQPGTMAGIRVFSASGHPVRTLLSNELLGTGGEVWWDGTDADGNLSPLGMYIILFDLYRADGWTNRLKKVAVLGGKL